MCQNRRRALDLPGSGQPTRNWGPRTSIGHVSGRSKRHGGPCGGDTRDLDWRSQLMVGILAPWAKAARTHFTRIGLMIRIPFFKWILCRKKKKVGHPFPSATQWTGRRPQESSWSHQLKWRPRARASRRFSDAVLPEPVTRSRTGFRWLGCSSWWSQESPSPGSYLSLGPTKTRDLAPPEFTASYIFALITDGIRRPVLWDGILESQPDLCTHCIFNHFQTLKIYLYESPRRTWEGQRLNIRGD